MPQTQNRWRTLGLCVLLSCLTVAVYWPVHRHGFIGYDDPDYVSENAQVRGGLSWPGVQWALGTSHAANWHPLTWLSHQLDVQLFGLAPGRHHLTNLGLHLANTCLLLLLLRRLTGAVWRSALVAGLFALHPLHVESVAWLSERKDLLSTFFFLLSLWGYQAYARDTGTPDPPTAPRVRPWLGYGAALLAYALGLMSKPMLVTLPCLLFLLDYWPLQRLRRLDRPRVARLVLEKAPFFLLAALSSAITLHVQRQGGTMSTLHDLALPARLGNAATAYLAYLGKTVWPADLAVFYPHPALGQGGAWPFWYVAAAGLVLAALSGWVLLRARQAPWWVTGWFWYVGTLVPVIGLVQVGSQAMADRYTYIPLLGIFIGGAWTLAAGSRRWAWARIPAVAVGGLSLVACGLLAARQVSFWQDDVTLFEHALTVEERNAPAHTILGAAYGRQGKYGLALMHARAAVQADPAYAGAWHTLGDVALAKGKPQEAIAHFQKALQFNPALANTWFRLAFAYASLGRLAEAATHYEAALRLEPDFTAAHNNLAAVYWSLGNRERALEAFAAAVRLAPADPDKRFNFGSALMEAAKPAEAAAELAAAVRLEPRHAQAQAQLGLLLAHDGRLDAALPHLEAALRLAPSAENHYNLGQTLALRGELAAARRHFQESLTLQPNAPAALNDLAWLLATAPTAELRDEAQAVRLAERACELTGRRRAGFLSTLAAAYAAAGRFTEAVGVGEQVRELAHAAGDAAGAQRAESRLELYRAGQPYRQPAPVKTP